MKLTVETSEILHELEISTVNEKMKMKTRIWKWNVGPPNQCAARLTQTSCNQCGSEACSFSPEYLRIQTTVIRRQQSSGGRWQWPQVMNDRQRTALVVTRATDRLNIWILVTSESARVAKKKEYFVRGTLKTIQLGLCHFRGRRSTLKNCSPFENKLNVPTK